MLKILKKQKVGKIKTAGKVKKLPLVIAPPGASFWVNNGPALRHLLDLSKFMDIITEEQFRYHTQRNGNDFSKWVETILGDRSCARALEAAKSVTLARRAVHHALKRYDV